MADQITIPGGLKVDKKIAIGVGLVAIIIAGYYYYRQRQANNAANSANAAGAANSSIDPQTGYAYGSPEDQAALAAMSGSTLGQSNTGASYVGGQVIGYDQYGNPIYGSGGGGVGGGPGGQFPGGFTSNAAWAQAAEAGMGSTGADAIAAALGKYLTGAPLTPDMQTAVQQAIAIEGYPPVAGPNGFPPSFKTVENPPPPQGGGKQVKVPNVVGKNGPPARAELSALGFKVVDLPRQTPFHHVSVVTGQSPTAGTMAAKGSTVTLSLKIS